MDDQDWSQDLPEGGNSANAPAAEPQELDRVVSFVHGAIRHFVLLNQPITTTQIGGLFGIPPESIALTLDGPRPHIRIFPVNGVFEGLRSNSAYFVDQQDVSSSGESTSPFISTPRPMSGFVPIARTRVSVGRSSAPPSPSTVAYSPPTPAAPGTTVHITLGEWANRGRKIESLRRQLPLRLTEPTANIDYIRQAIRSHFDDSSLELFTGNGALLEDSDASRGLDAWRRYSTRSRFWACPPHPKKRTHPTSDGSDSGEGQGTSDGEDVGTLAKTLKLALENVKIPKVKKLVGCPICFGEILPPKACTNCGRAACKKCVEETENKADENVEVFKCFFCREKFAKYIDILGIEFE